MGIELILIIFGLIAESASEKGESLYSAGHTAITIGIVLIIIEAVILVGGLLFVAFKDR